MDKQIINILNSYKSSAKARGYKFYLYYDYFKSIITGKCYYCGRPPSRKIKGKTALGYAGVDRIDNTKDYSEGNTVSCCKICNVSKGTMSQLKYEEYIWLMIKYQITEKFGEEVWQYVAEAIPKEKAFVSGLTWITISHPNFLRYVTDSNAKEYENAINEIGRLTFSWEELKSIKIDDEDRKNSYWYREYYGVK